MGEIYKMELFDSNELPFIPVFSFASVIETLEEQLEKYPANKDLQKLLEKIDKIPELREGFTDLNMFKKHKKILKELLTPLFPPLLADNELKAVTMPMSNFIFNPTRRLKDMLEDCEKDFRFADMRVENRSLYINCCNLILQAKYPNTTESAAPLFYDMKNRDGINCYYRVLYNTDQIEFIPTEKAVDLTEAEISLLFENFDDEEIWKEKFPPGSWIMKGFGLISLYNATIETAMSDLKHSLFKSSDLHFELDSHRISLLKSIFNLQELQYGFSYYNPETNEIIPNQINAFLPSLLLREGESNLRSLDLEHSIFESYLKRKRPFRISNVGQFVKRHPKDTVGIQLQKEGIKSCVLIPVTIEEDMMGIVELVSTVKYGFNSITTHKIEILRSLLSDVVENIHYELTNLTEAIIQREYTSLHPSVAWVFRKEAQNSLRSSSEDYHFKDIIFRDVYALFGQVDIRNSSVIRNESICRDLEAQIKLVLGVIEELQINHGVKLSAPQMKKLNSYLNRVKGRFETYTEQEAQKFIGEEIHSIISDLEIDPEKDVKTAAYLRSLDPHTALYYHERRKYDDSVNKINKMLMKTIDKRQKSIQKVFPHYFDRFATDGVEHNMFIGASIQPHKKFDLDLLYNLRLWQLQVIFEMVQKAYRLKKELPIPLEVASLILSYNTPFAIKFRTDEKRFDVDGAANARYEIIKKRVDKAYVKGSRERITEPGKVTVVCMNTAEEKEYLRYLKFLKKKKLIKNKIEFLQVEKLQGVAGLKALRVTPSLTDRIRGKNYFSYSDLLEEEKEDSLLHTS